MSCDVWIQHLVMYIKFIFLITKIWVGFTVCSIISSSISFAWYQSSVLWVTYETMANSFSVKWTNIQRTFEISIQAQFIYS